MFASSAFPNARNSTFIREPFCRYTLAVNGEAAVGVACEPGGWLSDGELVAELSANHQLMLIWIRWQKRLLDVSTKPEGHRLLKPWSFCRQNFPQSKTTEDWKQFDDVFIQMLQ